MNLKDVKSDVWVRLVVLALALVNQFATSMGLNPIDISNDQMYQTLTGVFTIIASLIAFWKNNSLTVSAQQSDVLMNNLKESAVKAIMSKSTDMLSENISEIKTPIVETPVETPVTDVVQPIVAEVVAPTNPQVIA